MRLIAKILIAILLNVATLVAAAYWIPGVTLVENAREVAIIAAALTALNFFLKPILKLLLGPLIVLTLGLGLLFINAAILFILDFLFVSLTIQGTVALVVMTLFVGIVNAAYHAATRSS